ncbi:MAG: hypothetical protein HOZ81_50340 [Streptomyces sp.]|nr:hypothetical protein [Streptomyces sp.]NUS24374.1 hypothetical protein [Streptomyces sp.]
MTATARDALYTVLMLGGVTGRGHTPDRSEKASALIDAHRAEVLAAAAADFRTYCPDHGTAEATHLVCLCRAADHLDLVAKHATP